MASLATSNPIFIKLRENRGMIFPLAFISLLMVILVPLPPDNTAPWTPPPGSTVPIGVGPLPTGPEGWTGPSGVSGTGSREVSVLTKPALLSQEMGGH